MTEESVKVDFGFDRSRNSPDMSLGNCDVGTVQSSVDSIMFRDQQGVLRGLRFGYTESGGTLMVANGDTITLNDEGTDVSVKEEFGTTHMATPIEEEVVALQNGEIRVTEERIGQLFGGEIPSIMLVFDASLIDSDSNTVENSVFAITSVLTTESVNGEPVGQETLYLLHDPFMKTDHNGLSSPSLIMQENARTEIREQTKVRIMTREEFEDADLHYVTGIDYVPSLDSGM